MHRKKLKSFFWINEIKLKLLGKKTDDLIYLVNGKQKSEKQVSFQLNKYEITKINIRKTEKKLYIYIYIYIYIYTEIKEL